MSEQSKLFTFDEFIARINDDVEALQEELKELIDSEVSEIKLKDSRKGVYVLSLYYDNEINVIIERIKHSKASLKSNFKPYPLSKELNNALHAIQILLHQEIDLIEASDPEQFG
jgi:predicted homoserine dehydrogenase-like protein